MKIMPRLSVFVMLLCMVMMPNAQGQGENSSSPNITFPPLPYPEDGLVPFISKKTLFFHYTKHHKGYFDKLVDLIKAKGMEHLSHEAIIQKSHDDPELISLFHAAAQVWNHSFYWSSMKPHGGGQPTGPIKDLIEKNFGSYEAFKSQFIKAGTDLFGSGWVWLVQDPDKTLKIVATSDADLPLLHGQKALLTCDVWEHAYYLDYQNRRKDYVEIFLDHLVNWDFPNQNLES